MAYLDLRELKLNDTDFDTFYNKDHKYFDIFLNNEEKNDFFTKYDKAFAIFPKNISRLPGSLDRQWENVVVYLKRIILKSNYNHIDNNLDELFRAQKINIHDTESIKNAFDFIFKTMAVKSFNYFNIHTYSNIKKIEYFYPKDPNLSRNENNIIRDKENITYLIFKEQTRSYISICLAFIHFMDPKIPLSQIKYKTDEKTPNYVLNVDENYVLNVDEPCTFVHSIYNVADININGSVETVKTDLRGHRIFKVTVGNIIAGIGPAIDENGEQEKNKDGELLFRRYGRREDIRFFFVLKDQSGVRQIYSYMYRYLPPIDRTKKINNVDYVELYNYIRIDILVPQEIFALWDPNSLDPFYIFYLKDSGNKANGRSIYNLETMGECDWYHTFYNYISLPEKKKGLFSRLFSRKGGNKKRKKNKGTKKYGKGKKSKQKRTKRN